ncbi:unnamed protein product [Cutaneotrichosporon oleaginosum]
MRGPLLAVLAALVAAAVPVDFSLRRDLLRAAPAINTERTRASPYATSHDEPELGARRVSHRRPGPRKPVPARAKQDTRRSRRLSQRCDRAERALRPPPADLCQ